MKVNTKIRYGLRAMMEIAMSRDENGVLQKDIAINQGISIKYLDSIIASLKLKGLIVNSKVRGGGYRLTRSAEKITMWDIYTAFETIDIVDCLKNEGYCDKSCTCMTRYYWDEFKNDFESILKRKSLKQIINKKHKDVIF